MDIRTITSQWNDVNLDRINHNFSELRGIEYRAIQDMLSTDPGKLTPIVNGISKPAELDMRLLNNYGINFIPKVNGIIHKVSVYCGSAGKLGFGLAAQTTNDVTTSELYFDTFDLKRGWNEVELNFPVEQGAQYTLFKRFVGDSILTNTTIVNGWADYPFMDDGLRFVAGKYLDDILTYRNYSTFFDIRVITSLAQIYKIANDRVKPPQQFYVGDNPPLDAQFWFKPVGGGS